MAKIAAIGERFLNKWMPTSATEAALMLDLFNAEDDDFPDYLGHVPKQVEIWLLANGFAGDAAALANTMLIEMSNHARGTQ